MNEICKTYKPEYIYCPICGTKLVYRHAISKKMIYFSSGKHIRIINLGYTCPSCKDDTIYFSQTANKFAWTGYTYSVKIMCMIAKLREAHKSREEICDFLFSKNIEISDRNVDMLYHKFLKVRNLDYHATILSAIQQMQEKFHQIAFSIDAITVNKSIFIMVYNYFTGDILAMEEFPSWQDEGLKEFLSYFLKKDLNITFIASIRKDAFLIPLIKKLCPSTTKIITFNKF